MCKPPVAAALGTGDHLCDIVPGRPDDSILLYRMTFERNWRDEPEQAQHTHHEGCCAHSRVDYGW